MNVEVLPAGEAAVDTELDAFFDACPTSYAQQTRRWRDVIVGLGVDEPLFLACRDAGRGGALLGVLPAYRFEGPLGAVLNSVPQAGPLGGIACGADTPRESVYTTLVEAFLDLARSRDCALASLITSPIWPDRDLYAGARSPDYALENSCLVLDIETAFDAHGQLVEASSNLRRNLKKAGTDALRVDEAQTPENVAEWYALHAERHREIGATPLPEALFTGALEHLVPAGEARFFFVRRTDDDALVAGGFYVCHGRVIDAFMPAMRSDASRLAPNFRLARHSMEWARSQGLRFYNWQASPPASSAAGGGVDRFKRQWGSRDHPYAYLTWVTGDVSRILAAQVDEITTGYPWHYVVPFDQLGGGPGDRPRASTRSDAWVARETSQ